ncbi:MAG: hypothetical protein ACRDZM_11235 [Acidimicrobiia bacterium]
MDEVHVPSNAPMGVGTRFTAVVKFMGGNTYTVDVTDFQPPGRIELTTIDGPMRPVATYLMEPTDGATRFTRHVDIPLQGILRIMKPVMQGMSKRRQIPFVQNLKTLLDQ